MKSGLEIAQEAELRPIADVAAEVGLDRMAKVDLGVRVHRNRPLEELSPQAVAVLHAALDRAGVARSAFPTLLHRAGIDDLADRLTAIAGPKVFTSRARLFSSFCFGTIKTAQSADVASEEAVMSPREIARAARRAIETSLERLGRGEAIVLFGEGSRSRTAAMQRLLPAVTR